MVQNEAVSHNTFNLMFSILISFLYVTVGCKEDPDEEAVEVGRGPRGQRVRRAVGAVRRCCWKPRTRTR